MLRNSVIKYSELKVPEFYPLKILHRDYQTIGVILKWNLSSCITKRWVLQTKYQYKTTLHSCSWTVSTTKKLQELDQHFNLYHSITRYSLLTSHQGHISDDLNFNILYFHMNCSLWTPECSKFYSVTYVRRKYAQFNILIDNILTTLGTSYCLVDHMEWPISWHHRWLFPVILLASSSSRLRTSVEHHQWLIFGQKKFDLPKTSKLSSSEALRSAIIPWSGSLNCTLQK